MTDNSQNPFVEFGSPIPKAPVIFVLPLAREPNDVVVCSTVAELAINAEIYGIPQWLYELALWYLRVHGDAIFHVLIDRRLFEHLK